MSTAERSLAQVRAAANSAVSTGSQGAAMNYLAGAILGLAEVVTELLG